MRILTDPMKIMKTNSRKIFPLWLLCLLLAGLGYAPPAPAQAVPELLNYQGVLLQGDGTAAPAGYKDIEFRIYNAATGGNLLWGRTHRVHLDAAGLFNVVLMEGGAPITTGNPPYTELTPVFTSAGSESRFLELTVVGSTPILPRQRFVTTAFAFLAADVAQASQNFTVNGALTVQQGARLHTLTVDQNATVGGSLTVATNLTVQQAATIHGQTTINDALTVGGNAHLPSRVSGNAVWAGGYPTPDAGRLFIGDGTGWQFHFSKQIDGATTDLVTIEDNGFMLIGGPMLVESSMVVQSSMVVEGIMDVGGSMVVASNMVVGGTMVTEGGMEVIGNMVVAGTLAKAAGSFRIDHPLDPANKCLQHSFVESPDMMNVYNGNITTDAQGDATVVLPEYCEALNQDFRYQLTAIGQFAQAIVATEIQDNRFTLKTDKPNVKVSWQVTGIRRDPYANDHRIQVEVEKTPGERGRYLYPPGYDPLASASSASPVGSTTGTETR